MIASRPKNNIKTKIKTFLIHTQTFYKQLPFKTLSKLLFRKCQIFICASSNHRDSRDPPKLKIFFDLFPIRVFQWLPLDSLYFVPLFDHFSKPEWNPVTFTMDKALFIYVDYLSENCEVCIPTSLYIPFLQIKLIKQAIFGCLAQLVEHHTHKYQFVLLLNRHGFETQLYIIFYFLIYMYKPYLLLV